MPGTVKCNYVFDEHEIIMDHIMEFYKKNPSESSSETPSKEWEFKLMTD